MGIDANFYFRTSVGPHDIMKALETLGKKNIEYHTTHTPEYLQISFKSSTPGWEKRSINFFFNSSDTFGFDCNHISLRSNEESIDLFHELAQMIGGVVQESDCTNDAVMYQKPGSGDFRWLVEQYYLRHANTPNSANEDIEAFVKWNEKDEV